MIKYVIDTSVIITFLTTPPNEREKLKSNSARALFNQIESGECTAVLPEIVLHETFYTLLGPRFPDTDLNQLISVIGRMLQWPGWRFSEKELDVYSRALEVLQKTPSLEFSDSVIIARAEIQNCRLATFDRRMAKAFSGNTWNAEA